MNYVSDILEENLQRELILLQESFVATDFSGIIEAQITQLCVKLLWPENIVNGMSRSVYPEQNFYA
jgi:hypothetical protein